MTDDEAWERQRAADIVARNVEATNALLALLQRPKFRHCLRTMAELQSSK